MLFCCTHCWPSSHVSLLSDTYNYFSLYFLYLVLFQPFFVFVTRCCSMSHALTVSMLSYLGKYITVQKWNQLLGCIMQSVILSFFFKLLFYFFLRTFRLCCSQSNLRPPPITLRPRALSNEEVCCIFCGQRLKSDGRGM